MPEPATGKIRREVNVRLLAATVAVVAVAAAAAYFWHAHQIEPLAKAFLDRAETLEGQDQFSDAAGYLFRYVSLQPENLEGHIRLAQTFDRSAKNANQKTRAVQLYLQAIGLATDRPELRLRLGRIAVGIRAAIPNAGLCRQAGSRKFA